MKKIYSTILFVFAFVAMINAQTTTINFGDSSYNPTNTPGVDTNLNAHPNWTSQAGWKADFANTQISNLKSNWQICTYNTAFKATVGQALSAKILVKLGSDTDAFIEAESFLLVGFQATPSTSGSTNTNRDAVILKSTNLAGDKVFIGSQGNGAFATDASITMAGKSTYEVIVEIVVGADAANSVLKTRVRNIGTSPQTSPIQTTTGGINQVVYDALTGATGAYLMMYNYNPFQGTEGVDYNISTISVINQIDITVSAGGVLSTNKNNAFEFNMYPNPVKNVLNINTKEPLQKISVIDLLGRTVLTPNVTKEVNLSSLSKGVYILALEAANGISTKKIIKE